MKSFSAYTTENALPIVVDAESADEARAKLAETAPEGHVRLIVCNGDAK